MKTKFITIEIPEDMDEERVREMLEALIFYERIRKKKLVEKIESILSKSELSDSDAERLAEELKEDIWKGIRRWLE